MPTEPCRKPGSTALSWEEGRPASITQKTVGQSKGSPALTRARGAQERLEHTEHKPLHLRPLAQAVYGPEKGLCI